MSILITVLVSFVCLIIILLALPVDFQCQAKINRFPSLKVRIGILGGMAAMSFAKESGETPQALFSFFNWKKASSTKNNQASAKPKPGRRKSSFQASRLLNRELWKAGASYLGTLKRSTNLALFLEGEYGTGDPAETGIIASFLAALFREEKSVHLSPNFLDATLDIRGEVRMRVVPLVVLYHTIRFAFSAPVRALWWPNLRKNRKDLKEVVSNV